MKDALKSVIQGTSKTAKNPSTDKAADGVSKSGATTKFPEGVQKSGPTTGKYGL